MHKCSLHFLLGNNWQDRKPGEPFTRKSDTEVERERMMRDMDAKSEKYYAEVRSCMDADFARTFVGGTRVQMLTCRSCRLG